MPSFKDVVGIVKNGQSLDDRAAQKCNGSDGTFPAGRAQPALGITGLSVILPYRVTEQTEHDAYR